MSVTSMIQSLFRNNPHGVDSSCIEDNLQIKISPLQEDWLIRNNRSLTESEEKIEATPMDDPYARPWGSGLFSIPDIRAWVVNKMSVFHDRLTELLRKRGIDLQPEMIFLRNAFGNVVMTTTHPNKDNIEALLNRDQALRRLFVSICATSVFLQAIDANPNFRDLYELNPEKAVEKFGVLGIHQSDPTVHLKATADGLTSFFA